MVHGDRVTVMCVCTHRHQATTDKPSCYCPQLLLHPAVTAPNTAGDFRAILALVRHARVGVLHCSVHYPSSPSHIPTMARFALTVLLVTALVAGAAAYCKTDSQCPRFVAACATS